MKNLNDVIRDWMSWAWDVFGPGYRLKGTIKHIEREIEEVKKCETDEELIEEFLDIAILGIAGAARVIWESKKNKDDFYDPQFVVDRITNQFNDKLEINKGRRWPDWRTLSEDESIEHFRGEEIGVDYCKICKEDFFKNGGRFVGFKLCISCDSTVHRYCGENFSRGFYCDDCAYDFKVV